MKYSNLDIESGRKMKYIRDNCDFVKDTHPLVMMNLEESKF